MSELRTQLIWQLRACVAGHGNAVFNRADAKELLAMIPLSQMPHDERGRAFSPDEIGDLCEAAAGVNLMRHKEIRDFHDSLLRGSSEPAPAHYTYESDTAALAVLHDQLAEMRERHVKELLQASRLDLALLALINNPSRKLSEGEKVLLGYIAVAYESEYMAACDETAERRQGELFPDVSGDNLPRCTHGLPIADNVDCDECNATQNTLRAQHAATHCEHNVPREIDCAACARFYFINTESGELMLAGEDYDSPPWKRRATLQESELFEIAQRAKHLFEARNRVD